MITMVGDENTIEKLVSNNLYLESLVLKQRACDRDVTPWITMSPTFKRVAVSIMLGTS